MPRLPSDARRQRALRSMAGGSLDGLVESSAPTVSPAGARRAARLGERRRVHEVWTDFCVVRGAFTDEYASGSRPDGWVQLAVQGGADGNVRVTDFADGDCGQILVEDAGGQSDDSGEVIGWDRLGTAPPTAELVAKVQTCDAYDSVGIHMRFDRDGDPSLSFRTSISPTNQGDTHNLAGPNESAQTAFAPDLSTWYWLRMRREGDTYRSKVWEAGTTEPDWMLEIVDATDIGDSLVAFGGLGATDCARRLDVLAVDFAGGTAPTEQP